MEQVKQYAETELAQPAKSSKINPKHISLIGTIALFFAMINYLPFTQPINQGLALLVCAALLWLTEAVHLSITALMIPVVSVFLGIFESKDALSGFSHPIIYLFFGGFVLAAAIHSQGIDKLIAQNLLSFSRGRLHIACFMLFGVTAFLSMWISNTATTTIMIPLALGLLSQLDRQKYLKTYVFVLLGVGYSANIGGIGTMLGSPPNAIAAAQANISFKEWLSFGIPTVLLMMPTMLASLYMLFKPELFFICHVSKNKEPLTLKAKATIAIFVLTAFCWIESKDLAAMLGGVKYFDTIIALCAVLILSALGLVKWSEIQQTTEWSVLILFGGGITLSKVLSVTGTSAFLAHQLSDALGGAEIALFLFTLLCFVVLLTNFASNTASATLLVPIFASIGAAFGISEFITCALIGVAANCAFMLPVGTPPNAIVYGSGYIKQGEMVRAGLFINIAAIFILFGLAKFLWNI
jgi:solute carrier family 13 (sodium-dependent dicarboxylate transporter), member 2/3/5